MRLCALLAALALAGCGCSATSSDASDSGIRGQAVIAPVCPVEPCDLIVPPYRGPFEVRRDGAVVETVNTGEDGSFRVALAPGRYILSSEAEGLQFLTPVTVTVRAHEFTEVMLTFDSGIR